MILILLITVVIIINNTLVPVFFELAEVEAVRIANQAINEAVDNEIENVHYEDLITYKLDKNGNIVLMQPNTREINRFSSRLSLSIQRKLEKLEDVEVVIPVFRIIGLDLFAALGPNFKAKVLPAGFVHPPAIRDSFEAAGINQIRHKIYLHVNINIKLIVPFVQKTTQVEADLPLIEVTIMGEVPQVYVGLNGKEISGIIDKFR